MKSHLLNVTGLTKVFFGNKVLKKVDFTLDAGEVHALIGENGAGKSTLVKILMGEYIRDGGEISLNGEPVNFASPAEALEAGIAMIHQELSPVLDMTVADNIFMGREISSLGLVNDKAQIKRSAEYLSQLGLDIDPRRKMRDLSIAEMQMVEISKIVSLGAKIIVMDEPTSAIPEAEVQKLFEVIGILKGQDVAIIYISHKLDELYEIADTVSVLRDGALVLHGDLAGVRKEDLINAMVGRELNDYYPEKTSERGNVLLRVSHATSPNEFEDISFDLHQGEILGIAGLMGAGRTELVSAVFGASGLEKGEIYLRGTQVKIKRVDIAVKQKIAMITEDRKLTGLNLKGSVTDNLLMVAGQEFTKFGVLDRKRTSRKVAEVVKQLSIKVNSPSDGVKFLSGGNQQKVVLAKWILCDPDIYILDEPTRGIDVGAKSEIYRLMRELVHQGKSIIMVSSEMPEIIGMCDRVIVLHEGKKTGELQKSEITQEKIMAFASGEELES